MRPAEFVLTQFTLAVIQLIAPETMTPIVVVPVITAVGIVTTVFVPALHFSINSALALLFTAFRHKALATLKLKTDGKSNTLGG